MIATHKYPHPLFVFYISRSGIIQKYSFMVAVWIERYLPSEGGEKGKRALKERESVILHN